MLHLMYPYGGIIIAPFVAGYLASLICRFRVSRGLRPGYGTLAASVLTSVLVVWLITFGDEILKANNGKVDMLVMLLITGLPSAFLAMIAASFMIDRYRDSALGRVKAITGAIVCCGIAILLGILAGVVIFRF